MPETYSHVVWKKHLGEIMEDPDKFYMVSKDSKIAMVEVRLDWRCYINIGYEDPPRHIQWNTISSVWMQTFIRPSEEILGPGYPPLALIHTGFSDSRQEHFTIFIFDLS